MSENNLSLQGDSCIDQAYAVHVAGQSVTVEMGKPREQRLTPECFDERPLTIAPSLASPLFYVGLDEKGLMCRVVSVATEDRKVVGALTGGWIAEGLVVTKATLKEMPKYINAARKAFEPKEPKDGPGEPSGEVHEPKSGPGELAE